MKLLGLSLNIATVMTFSISLGLIVDGSFHLAFAHHRSISSDEYHYENILPIIFSSAILIVSFSIFSTNSFLPIREFGICLAVNIFAGLIFDIFCLPRLFPQNIKS